MNGRSGQSFSAAGSVPSSTPNQLSTSGPLNCHPVSRIVNHFSDLPRWVVLEGALPGMVETNHGDEGNEPIAPGRRLHLLILHLAFAVRSLGYCWNRTMPTQFYTSTSSSQFAIRRIMPSSGIVLTHRDTLSYSLRKFESRLAQFEQTRSAPAHSPKFLHTAKISRSNLEGDARERDC